MANCRLVTPTLSHAHFLARLETRASELSAATGGQNSDRQASVNLLNTLRSPLLSLLDYFCEAPC